MSTSFIDPSAEVHELARIGEGVRVWHNAQIRENATIGDNVIVGKGSYVGVGVTVGSDSKIQNNALIYEPTQIGKGVFVGPGVIFTNDLHPRAINSDGVQKVSRDWNPSGVSVQDGASIGAGAICVAPLSIGRWSLIAAGAVVTRDVPDFALMMGSPARQVAWVGKSGVRLTPEGNNRFKCPVSGEEYREDNGILREC